MSVHRVRVRARRCAVLAGRGLAVVRAGARPFGPASRQRAGGPWWALALWAVLAATPAVGCPVPMPVPPPGEHVVRETDAVVAGRIIAVPEARETGTITIVRLGVVVDEVHHGAADARFEVWTSGCHAPIPSRGEKLILLIAGRVVDGKPAATGIYERTTRRDYDAWRAFLDQR